MSGVQEEISKNNLPKNFINEFVRWLDENNYSYKTILCYLKSINCLLEFDSQRTLISENKINNFLEKEPTINNKSAVKKFIEFFEKKYNLKFEIKNIRYSKIRKRRKENLLTKEEIKVLIESMPDKKGLYRFKLLTELISKTGMMVCEVIGLKIGNIDFPTWIKDKTKDGRIILNKKNSDIKITISSEMMNKLSEQCKDSKDEGYTRINDSFVFDFGYYRFLRLQKKKQRKLEDPSRICYDEKILNMKFLEKSVAYYRKILARVSKEVLKKHVDPQMIRHSF